jgi:hypothetical protein
LSNQLTKPNPLAQELRERMCPSCQQGLHSNCRGYYMCAPSGGRIDSKNGDQCMCTHEKQQCPECPLDFTTNCRLDCEAEAQHNADILAALRRAGI